MYLGVTPQPKGQDPNPPNFGSRYIRTSIPFDSERPSLARVTRVGDGHVPTVEHVPQRGGSLALPKFWYPTYAHTV